LKAAYVLLHLVNYKGTTRIIKSYWFTIVLLGQRSVCKCCEYNDYPKYHATHG
jgi:hypothetical protein